MRRFTGMPVLNTAEKIRQRLLCLAIASEDVGNADPRAMQVAISAWDCFARVGPAEGERAIAQAVVYLACAPGKSNALYTAFKAAMSDARERPDYDVLVHLYRADQPDERDGVWAGNTTPTTKPNAYAAGEEYFLQEMAQTRYYHPTNRGLEGKIGESSPGSPTDQKQPYKTLPLVRSLR